MDDEIVLRSLKPEDLPTVARVHMNSFPESALTRLGSSIVERYYLWQLTGPHEKVRATGAFIGGECAGFSFSGVFSGSTSGFIRRNSAFLIGEVLRRPRLLFNKLYLKRLAEGVRLLFRSFKKTGKKKTISTANAEKPVVYGILSIAVAENFQKSGIGRLLMQDAEEEAIRCGQRRICLTVHPENEKAVRFYEKQNWQKDVRNGRWNGAMIKILNPDETLAAQEEKNFFRRMRLSAN